MRHRYSFFGKKSMKTIAIVGSSMTVAFILGIQTAGDVQPIVGEIRAGGTVLLGDMNGNSTIDPDDARIAIELTKGLRTPTPEELAADPDQNFVITIEDVSAILDSMTTR